jgi:hypothetical protein
MGGNRNACSLAHINVPLLLIAGRKRKKEKKEIRRRLLRRCQTNELVSGPESGVTV